MSWTAAFKPEGHSWSGFEEADAYGAALAHIERVGIMVCWAIVGGVRLDEKCWAGPPLGWQPVCGLSHLRHWL